MTMRTSGGTHGHDDDWGHSHDDHRRGTAMTTTRGAPHDHEDEQEHP